MGALQVHDSPVLLELCTFTACSCISGPLFSTGGACHVESTEALTIRSCEFVDCQVMHGTLS